MTLLTPWFLAGLAALAPLVALHLRRRRRQRAVSSLLLWRELPSTSAGRRRAALVLPLLLALQALIVVLIVLGLAQPRGDARTSGREGRPAQVFVLDDALRSGSGDAAGARLTAARQEVDRRLAQVASGTPVTVVIAAAAPRLLAVATSPRAARGALAALATAPAPPGDAPPSDLRGGLALAGGQLHGSGGRVTLLHAPEDTPPPVRTDDVAYSAVAIGARGPAQALEQPVGRCAPGDVGGEGATGNAGPAGRGGATGSAGTDGSGGSVGDRTDAPAPLSCSVFAAIRNDAPTAARERLTVERGGRIVASRTLSIAGESRAGISFDAAPGAELTLRLVGAQPGAAAARANVTVPGMPEPADVTLVSSRPLSAPLARALTSVPGVALRLVAPSEYAAGDNAPPESATGDNGATDLVVFDRWAPDGALPDGPAVLMVAPPHLPGGRVGAALPDPQLSGTDAADPLLAGVDLDGLAIAAGAARSIALPPLLRAIAWAPGGPLIAAGQGAADSRVALLAFDPQASTLPQLPAFPILIANVVAWSLEDLAPDGATRQAGTAASRGGPVPLVLRATDGGAVAPGHRPGWWPWLVAAALLVLLAEWSYPRWATRKVARA